MEDSGVHIEYSEDEGSGSAYESGDEIDSFLEEVMDTMVIHDDDLPELPDASEISHDASDLVPTRYMGFDPSILRGTLANGMTYFVKSNPTPRKRADLQLVMNVGSVDELDTEQGYAHFIEHLAFRASTDTADQTQFDVLRLLELHGVAFGAHQNAYTSFDETVYELHVPLDDMTLFPQFLGALKKFCFDVRLSERDVQQEKSIIVEEWRESQGASARLADAYAKELFAGTKYADRMPIGKMEMIHAATSESVKAFYKRLYRPEVACIIVVGDFDDIDGIVDAIRSTFEGIPRGQPATKDEQLPIYARMMSKPAPHPCSIIVQTDAEATEPSFSIDFKQTNPPVEQWETVGEFRDYLVGRILRSICEERLQKIVLEGDPSFRGSACVPSYPHAMMWSISVQILPVEGRVLEAIQTLVGILATIRREGVSAKELDRSKRQLLAAVEREWRGRDTTSSDSICGDVKRHFLFRSCMPGVDEDLRIAKLLLPSINLSEVREYGRTRLSFADNSVVHLTMPAESSFPLMRTSTAPTVAILKEIFAAAEESATTSPQLVKLESGDGEDILDLEVNVPWPNGLVVEQRYDPTNNIHQIRFENGTELVIKKTDFTDDEVVFGAVAHGGLSEIPLDQIHSCRAATTLAEEVGIFGIRPSDLVDFWAETEIAVEPDISHYHRSIDGSCSSADISLVFQLLHRLFTCDLTVDAERMAVVEKMMTSMLEATQRSPMTLFETTTHKLVTNHHPYFEDWVASDVKKVNPRFALEYFKRVFSDPSEFSFVFVGDLDVAEIVRLTSHYIASIPSVIPKDQRITRPTVKGLNWAFPDRVKHKVIRQPMEDDLCATNVVFPVTVGGRYEKTSVSRYRENLELNRVAQVLERRLLEVLRFELGSIYDISVGLDLSTCAHPATPEDPFYGTMSIRFTCNPADATKLQRAVFDVIDSIIQDGPTVEEAQKALESDKLNRATSQRTNMHWLAYCTAAYSSARYTGDMAQFLTDTFAFQSTVLNGITNDIIQSSARAVLAHHRDRHVLVCLLPGWKSNLIRTAAAQPVTTLGIACAALAAIGFVALRIAGNRK